jgi:hypothetical protein
MAEPRRQPGAENHRQLTGKPAGKPPANHRQTTGKPPENHRQTTGKPPANHRQPTGNRPAPTSNPAATQAAEICQSARMRFAESAGPRSPLRVAVVTFGAIVLVGTIIALLLFGKDAVIADDPSSPGRTAGQGVGVLGLIGAAIAYAVQRRRQP